jgi:hypothetical protein
MNRMTEKAYPVMTEEEVDRLIMDYCQNKSQTLTVGAEANLLKFKDMTGVRRKRTPSAGITSRTSRTATRHWRAWA